MYDYFPGYNNFRSVTFTLIMILFAMPLLGLLGLENMLTHGLDKVRKRKLLIAFGSTGGLCLILWLVAGMFGFTREIDAQLPPWFVDALAEDRKSLFRSDAIRSFLFILVAFAVIYFEAYRRFSAFAFYAFMIFIVTVDLAVVDKRYFKENNFKRRVDNSFFAMTEADQQILRDTSDYRVYNLTYLTGSGDHPFGEARTSYHHNSIGGYHGAKLRRYAEFYDSCMVPATEAFVQQIQQGNSNFDSLHAFNMLNIKYIYIGPTRQNVILNRSANGNAWFAGEVLRAQSPAEELASTCAMDKKTTAVIDVSQFPVADFSLDSTGTITQTSNRMNSLQYESESGSAGLAVFSEIYYPGWVATIDGNEANILRVNYILRGLEIPAGKHTIVFRFEPKAYTVGNKVTTASSWLVLILLLGSIYWSLREPMEQKQQAAKVKV
jgi:hypothetical protein